MRVYKFRIFMSSLYESFAGLLNKIGELFYIVNNSCV